MTVPEEEGGDDVYETETEKDVTTENETEEDFDAKPDRFDINKNRIRR